MTTTANADTETSPNPKAAELDYILETSHFLWTVVLPALEMTKPPSALGEALFPLFKLVIAAHAKGEPKYRCIETLVQGYVGLKTARWLVDHGIIDSNNYVIVFRNSCYTGCLDVAEWILDTFKTSDGHYIAIYGNFLSLYTCCAFGRLDTAQFLLKKFGVEINYSIADINLAFEQACANNHLDIAQWLATVGNLTVHNLRDRDIQAFFNSCYCGHLDIAKWLADTFGLTAVDARRTGDNLFTGSLREGYLHVAQWLVERFNLDAPLQLADGQILPPMDIKKPLRDSCSRGYLHIAKWLVEKFGWPCDFPIVKVLGKSCRHGHLHVARWLANTRGMTAKDVRVFDKYTALQFQARKSTWRVAVWFVAMFNLEDRWVT